MEAGSCFGSSNEALCSLAAALEVQLAKWGKQSKQGKLGGKFAEPGGVQVALESHLEATWRPHGGHLETTLNPSRPKRRPEAPQERPCGARELPSCTQELQSRAQEPPSSAQEQPSWVQGATKRLQVEPKRRPRGSKLAPRGAQEGPSLAENAFKDHLESTREAFE